MSTITSPPKADSDYSDKIFISYSRCDKAWVDGYLRRLLEAARVPYAIDEDDFEIGQLLDESIRQMIKHCRYTLFVMTPDWVNRKWTSYEAELAAKNNSTGGEIRVLPMKLKDCTVPQKFAANLYLDISRARTRDTEIIKLLRRLGVADKDIELAKASVAKKPLLFLVEVIDSEPDIRDKMSEVDALLDEIEQSNDVLQKNKTLHDRLQEAEYPLKQLMEHLLDSGLTLSEPKHWFQIRGATTALRQSLQLLSDFVDTVDECLVDVSVVNPFMGLADDIDLAYRNRDAPSFRAFVEELPSKFSRALPRVNQNIVNLVKQRKLNDLVQNLSKIYELVADIEFDDDVLALLQQFRSLIEELVELEKTIQDEVADHSQLQTAEDELPACGPLEDQSFYKITRLFPRVKRAIDCLKLTDRYTRLMENYRQLNEQLDDDTSIRDDCFEESVKWNFREFVDELKYTFNKLDIDLLADCDKLKPGSDKLNELLNRMKPYDH